LADGNIEFLGRLDDQVKIRGYRIELGEIETVLCQHPAILEAVVLVQEGDFEGKFLVAYIVPAPHLTPSNDDPRSHLRKRLPDYMIPRTFVHLDFLPLTSNGKVDKNALLSSNHRERVGARSYVEPRNPIEWVLAAIWSELLKMKRVGVHDDFFELGGHSLLAIRLIAQIREECQVDLSVRQLFEFPTISGLAAKITRVTDESKKLRDDEQRSRLIEIQRGSIGEPVFIVPGGLGGEPDLLKYIRLARSVGPEYSFIGLVARDSNGIGSQHASVRDLAAEYLGEIRSLQSNGPYFLLGECIGGIVAYEMACQLRQQNQEVALLALMDSSRPTFYRYFRFRCAKIRSGYRKVYYGFAHNYYVQRLVFHLNKIGQVSWREKLPYLMQKSAVGLSLFPKSLPKIERQATPRPVAEENTYSKAEQDRYFRTLRRHRPKPYDGKLTLIVNEELYERNPSGEWGDLVAENVEVQKALGTHDTYLHDNAKTTAKIFKQCLDRARERYWRSKSTAAS
jgi:acyl carrier protein